MRRALQVGVCICKSLVNWILATRSGVFVSAKVEDVLPELLKRWDDPVAGGGEGRTAVLLDPPRKGCWPQTLDLLREARPSQVIYVSCHPATMARDLNILCADDPPGGPPLQHHPGRADTPPTRHLDQVEWEFAGSSQVWKRAR